jgi:glycosyltransferase involved in cell wall biosynthesis
MFVEQRETGDPQVVGFAPPMCFSGRLLRVARRAYMWHDSKNVRSAHLKDDRSQHGALPLRQLPDADVLNLHWVSGFLDHRLFIPAAARRAPLVWTLHDMNSFTGGCDCDLGCGRFSSQCGNCPFLGSEKENDLSRTIWKRKRAAYRRIAPGRLHLVTPSRWLAAEATRSSLLRDRPVTVIPNGLDVSVFSPKNRSLARQFFGLPHDKKVLLWVVWTKAGWDRGLKGGELFQQTLAGLKNHEDFLVVTVGGGNPLGNLPVPHVSLGHISDERLMALAYSAADLFVSSSMQDNFPYTMLEAMACGVPVVAFRVGGIPEIVREDVTGSLASLGDAAGMSKAICQTLADPARLSEMAANCRRIAVEEYSMETCAKRYTALYEKVLAANGVSRQEEGRPVPQMAAAQ